MIHCAHQNFLAQWLSPASNVRTDEYGGSPENRRRYPLEVLKAVREAVGEDMVIEMRVSAVEGIPGGMEFEESLAFMKEARSMWISSMCLKVRFFICRRVIVYRHIFVNLTNR